MRKIIYFAILTLSIIACREEASDVPCYGYNSISPLDTSAINAGKKSPSAQFRAFWTAMNCNYHMWDYEERFGMDWDDVYTRYLPVFQEFDQRVAAGGTISDEEFSKVYKDIVAPLHDGHFALRMSNYWVPNPSGNFKNIVPQFDRVLCRKDASRDSLPFMKYGNKHLLYYYSTTTANPNRMIEHKEVEDSTMGERIPRVDMYLYDHWAFSHAYGCFSDNIIYMRIKDFTLDSSLNPNSPSYAYNYSRNIREWWHTWYEKVQSLHDSGSLRGLIIDLRSNFGGDAANHKYLFGALQPYASGSNTYQVGWIRAKNGIGRLDYTGKMPFLLDTYQEPHATITEPIVVLVNSYTASMAEISTLVAKQMNNAVVMGTTTWGAMSPMPDDYEFTYSGSVGSLLAPFSINMPSYTFYPLDETILEGIGIEPDIYVPFDAELYNSTGRDSQLERALDYLRQEN